MNQRTLRSRFTDIIVKLQDFDKSKQIMLEQGLSVDAHINPMEYENNLRTKMKDCFKNVFDNSVQMEIDLQTIYTMSYTDHFLFLVLHAFKHFTSGGLGIRQLVDILLLKKSTIKRLTGSI